VKPNALLIDSHDNVVTVLQAVPEGGRVHWARGCEPVVTRAEIAVGHKVAIEPIPAGTAVRKYGHPIGTAGGPIAPGDWVHTHNLEAVKE
jgi:hypothetical protein